MSWSDTVSPLPPLQDVIDDFVLNKQAYRGLVRVYKCNINEVDIDEVEKNYGDKIIKLLDCLRNELQSIVYDINIHTEMSKLNNQGFDTIVADFHSINKPSYQGDILIDEVSQCFNEIREVCEQFTEKGSGFWINRINYIEISIGKYKPHKCGCSTMELPDQLKKKVLNTTKNRY